MNEFLKKTLLYVFFIALGTLFAEVLSFSYIPSLFSPWSYLPYGLLYILFVDYIIRKQVKDWGTIYLFGVLVGFLTEAYITKVIFSGWSNSAFTFGGFAVLEFFILAFFFHPLFSFMLPVYIAKNFFNFPIAVKEGKRKNLVMAILPLYPVLFSFSYPADGSFATEFLISFFVLSIWIVMLKYSGKINNFILSKYARFGVLGFGLVFYAFAFFIFANPFLGSEEVVLPDLYSFIVSMIFVLLVGRLIVLRNRKNSLLSVKYEPSFRIWNYLAYGIFFLAITISLIFVTVPFREGLSEILSTFLFLGAVLGTVFFIFILIKSLFGKKLKL